MPRSDMGGRSAGGNHDAAVGKHVEAIQVLTGHNVIALVMLDSTACPYVICPAYRQLSTLQVLADIDWLSARAEED